MNKILQTLFLLIAFAGKNYAQPAVLPSNPNDDIIRLATNFKADYGSLSRFYHIQNAPERRERFKHFYNDYQTQLHQIPFNTLSTTNKADYILIAKHLESELSHLQIEAEAYSALKKWIIPGEPLYLLEQQRRRGKHLDAAKVASQLNEITINYQKLNNQLETEKVKFTKKLTLRGFSIIQGQLAALESVYEFYHKYDPDFDWWITTPYKNLKNTLKTYSENLKKSLDPLSLSKDDGSGILGNPIGEKELLRQLKDEMIPYTPEELIEIALKEFAWSDNELLKATRELGFGTDYKAAQEYVKNQYVKVGYQPEEMLKLYNESVDFIKKHKLVTIPPIAEETWRMTMLSPERQRIAPFFLGGEVLQIAYPTTDMDQEDKLMSLRGNNPHFARAVVHHELIAGHHLQGFMNNRYKSYRFFNTPFWTEGWALYWELLLWDKGFAKTPEDRIGMLFWRMHRSARVIFSLNYHLEKWTPQQCIDYLVDKVGHERATAEGEVRRSFTGSYGPLYQIAYLIGGLQFYELRKELVKSGKMTDKSFHDAILQENCMPVEMLRAIITNTPPDKHFKSTWKFYNK